MFKYIRLLLLFIGFFISFNSIAQTIVPDGILFQAVARDANGNAAVSRTVYAKVSIIKGSTTGASVYTESFQVTSTEEGIFTIVIGKGTRTSGATNLLAIDWSSGIFYMNLQLAVAPTLPDPNWTPTNEYVDLGTSQFWNVPYAFVAGRAAVSDSSLSIGTIVPSIKGGTGVNNNGKTITIANNIITKGIGDLTITTTAASNIIFPTTGTLATLAGTETLSNKTIISPVITGRPVTVTQDTATADSTIATTLFVSKKVSALAAAAGATAGEKLNLSDTSAMLSKRIGRDTISLSNRINIKLDSAQIPGIIAPYLQSVSGMKYSDTAAMLTSRFARDTASLSNRINTLTTNTTSNLAAEIARATAAENLLTNNLAAEVSRAKSKSTSDSSLIVNRLVTDSAILASKSRADSTTLAIKSSADSTTLTIKLRGDSTTLASRIRVAELKSTSDSTTFTSKLRGDSTTLASRIRVAELKSTSDSTLIINRLVTDSTVLASKMRSDSASIKASLNTETTRAIAAEALKVNLSDTAAMLSMRITRDTISLSNRINTLGSSASGDLAAEIARATAAENILTTNLAAESSRAKGKSTADSVAVYTKIVADSNVLRTLINIANTNIANNLAKEKADSLTLASRIVSSENNITINTTDITTNLNKQKIDSLLLRGLININTSTINTNLLKSQTDSLTLATKIRSDSTNLYAKSIADSTVLRGLINTNTNDINTNRTNIANNAINISTNATNIAANTAAINNRVSFTDMPAFLLPYLKIDDTLNMLANYRAAMIDNNTRIAALIADTATLITRFSYKENLSNKTTDVNADGTSNVKYPSAKAVKDFVDNAVVVATPDATTASKGKIQLAGDLTGIAAAPTVNSVGGSSSSTIHTAELLANAATSANTINTIVKRDASGNFSAGNITASLTGNVIGDLVGNVTGNLAGNASTTTKLAAPINIYGNPFDGSTNLTQAIAGTFGGTGVNNGIKTITLGGNILTANSFTTAGNYSTTLTSTGITDITLPTTGTIATLAGTETLTNKTIASVILTGVPTAPTASAGTNNTQLATTAFVTATTSAATPDASTTVKGKVQLAGDLGGIATSPTVNTVGGSTASNINAAELLANAATDANTPNTIVKRDASGNFIAGNITASLTGNVTGNLAGNASTTTKLAAPINIYGNPFDGSTNLTQAIAGTFGGTGVNNGIKTITLGGNILTANSFTTAGNFNTTLRSTAATDITLPTTGTIATLAGTESMTNKTIVDVNLTGVPIAPTAAAGTSTTQVATTAFVTATTSAATPDASTTVKGKVQLAGDLGGIATSPTVNTVGGSSAANISAAELLANAATDANTPNTIVKRDASGNFIAGNISASLTGNVTGNLNGNATTATTAGNITATSNTTLTSLANLNTVGTITSGVWSGTIIDVAHGGTGLATTSQNYIFAGPIAGSGAPSFRALTSADVPAGSGNYIFNSTTQQTSSNFNISGTGVIGTSLTAGSLSLTTALSASSGGTGINNGTKTITLGGNVLTGGNFTTIGSSPIILRTSGETDITLPTTGTLATTAQLQAIQGGTFSGGQITGIVFPENGGTGIANLNTKTITLGGPLVTTGTGTITLNSSASGSTITLPTSGTIATLAGTETLTSKTVVDAILTGVPTAPTAAAGTSTKQVATTEFVTATTTAATPDASTTVKGKIQLAGDLGGTATSPTVNTVGGSSSTTIRTAELLANAATNLNTASTIVKRDASGNFNAGTITGNLTGNASTATIAGNITATSNTTLTSLANLNTVGTITSGVWSATTIDVAHGGTGATTTSQSFVFAGPTSGAGAPTFRALTSADVPAGSGSYIANGTTQQASSNFNISGNGVIGTSLTAGSLTLNNALSVENGGTGIATAPTNGQIDIGTSGGTFARSNITAGTGVSIANGNGSITISATGSGGTVTNVSALTLGTTGTDVNSTVANSTTTPTITLNIPSASSTARGLITTGAQTIAGAKTFSGTTVFNSDITVNGLTVGAGPNNTITTNTVLGKNALASSSTSDYNTAIGYRALNSNGANAFGNTAVGANAINLNTSGERNTAVGESAMTKNTTGNSNTAVGEYALRDNSVGSDNTSVGNFALASNIGSKNTAIGSGANTTSTTIENTTAIGYGSTVSASNTIQLGNTDIANVKTSGTITAGNVTYPKTHNSTANQVLSIDASGIASFNSLGAAGATLTNGKILVGNASNVGTEVTVSGDITMTNAGEVSITAGAVSTADLANSAVTYAKIQNITAGKLIGSTIASAAAPGEVTIGTGLSLSGGTLTASGSGGTVTSVNPITVTASGSSFTSTVTNASSTPSIALTIPLASVSGTTAGLLSKADYDIFNAKQSPISLRFRSGGDYNIGIGARNGYETLGSSLTPTGTNNIAIGNNAMGVYYINDLTGSHNIALGTEAGGRNTTGSDNIFLGSSAGMNNYNGSQNTFIGRLADVNSDRGYNNGYTNATAIGYEAKVSGSNKIQLGNGSVTNVSTWGTLTAGTVTYPNVHNSIANQVLTINAAGTASWAPNSSASLSGGVAGAIPYQSGVGVTGYTAAGTAGQILTSAGTGAPTWVTTVPVANGGTGATTLASNAVLLGNGTSAVQTVAPGTSGNILTSNGTTWTSVAASSSGVTTLGNISATSNVKGATISGTTLTLTAADGTNGGVVTTAAQTFAGTKSFADVNLSGAITGSSTASSTIAGFNAALSTVTSNITISSANAATYNGKVLVCSGSAFTVTFDSNVPVGFSCMILQSDNNVISFSGTSNRYNYSQTSGLYAIATALCFASGNILLTGDLQ